MKKWIVLSLAAAVLTACGQKEEKVEKTNPKTEQQATAATETSSSSSNQEKTEKNSPADYARFADYHIPDEDAIEATKPYIGYYTGSYTTTLDTISKDTKDANTPLNYKMEVVIYDDGSYVKRVTYEAEGGTQDQTVFITKNNDIKYILKGSVYSSGTFRMTYGKLEPLSHTSVYQTRLDSNGDILPIYKTEYDVYNLPSFGLSIENDDIFLIDAQPSSEDEALKIEMKPAGKIPKSLKFTPYQIEQYAKTLDKGYQEIETITYQFDTINDFVQNTTSPEDSLELIDPKTLTGYFTLDNKEVKNIKYAFKEKDSETIIAYDGNYIWSLSTTYDNLKKAELRFGQRNNDFIDLREFEDN